jgi:L-ribulose-5-phosphate 4-epimerase
MPRNASPSKERSVNQFSSENVFSYEQRIEMICYAQSAADYGLVPNTQGNISIRDPETDLILLTPHDLPYGTMTPDDLVVVNPAGEQLSGRREPSFEMPVHCAVYRARPDVYALLHTEPVYTNVLGVLGKPIKPVIANLLVYMGGPVPVMPFMVSGSDEFGQEMLKVMGDGYGVVWANHGLLTVGETMDEALRRSVVVEYAAHIYHEALMHGEPVLVTHEQLQGSLA